MRAGICLAIACLVALFAAVPELRAQAAADAKADAVIAEDLSSADRADQYLSRGLARATLGLNEDALIDLTLAINQHALPAADQARALYNRGLLLEQMGDKKHAAGDYAGALSLDPGFESASARLNALNQSLPPTIPLKPRSDAGEAQPVSVSLALGLKPALAEGNPKDQLQVQLGAWRTEAEANEKWTEISTRAGVLLQDFTPDIFAADVPGKGRYFRLRLGPMNKNAAAKLCRELHARELACISVKSS